MHVNSLGVEWQLIDGRVGEKVGECISEEEEDSKAVLSVQQMHN